MSEPSGVPFFLFLSSVAQPNAVVEASQTNISLGLIDEVQLSSVAREDGFIPLEELGDQRLSESCCMSGCEPCVWETFYVEQAACRRTASQATCKHKAVVLEMQHDKHSTAIADTILDPFRLFPCLFPLFGVRSSVAIPSAASTVIVSLFSR